MTNKNVEKPVPKSALIPLAITAVASAKDPTVHKKMFGSGPSSAIATRMARSIIANEELNSIMRIFKSLEYPGLFIKEFSETIKNEVK